MHDEADIDFSHPSPGRPDESAEHELRWDLAPQVTPAGEEHGLTADASGAVRVSGVSPQHTGAKQLWFGRVSNKPGYRSLPHYHGQAETGGFVFRGHGRIYYGPGYQQYVDMTEGDWVFVPPWMPHVEANMSTTEELVWLTTRTPDNIVINLPDVDDRELEGFRRA